MTKDSNSSPWTDLFSRLAEQLRRIEENLDGQKEGESHQPGWSMGWKFTLGSGSSTHSGPTPFSSANSSAAKRSPEPSSTSPKKIPVIPRSFGFIEVHEEEDHLLIIVDLPGLSDGGLHVEVVGEDLLVLTIGEGDFQESREILLPRPSKGVDLQREGTIWSIRASLEH